MNAAAEITALLADAGRGNRAAWERLMPLVYEELRNVAQAQMRRERAGHTLQPTALVHEAYVKLAGQHQADWRNRAHFFGGAAQVMRRILVDHVRARRAAKRGGGAIQENGTLDEIAVSFEQRSTDLLDLDQALDKLASFDPQQCRIVELRFFGGLSIEETAEVLGVATSTVERGWRIARAWLLREIGEEGVK